ncbi:hypothetical protein ABI59_06530 [Acidobacteria bacterium Mor1]|nr:hypothetical protein ABI59_06530 [Acidobacteria bacterium Mor1]
MSNTPQRAVNGETVVLVHGLWMYSWAMSPLSLRLQQMGFRTHKFSYPSVRKDLEANGRQLAAYVQGLDCERVHLVGHSLGGLVIRAMLGTHSGLPDGRVVTLGTPHLASRPGDVMMSHKIGQQIVGASIRDLTDGTVHSWQVPEGREIGVIAGTMPVGLGQLVTRFREPNDGMVSLSESKLPGCTEYLVMQVSHTALVLSPAVAERIASFLTCGRFTGERAEAV